MGTRGLALSKALARSDVLGVLGSLVLVGLWIQTALLRLLRSRHSSADANLKLGMSDIDRNSFLVPLTFLFRDLSHLLASPHAIVHHWIFSGLFGPLRF